MILFQIAYPSLFFVLVIEFQVFNLVNFYPYTLIPTWNHSPHWPYTLFLSPPNFFRPNFKTSPSFSKCLNRQQLALILKFLPLLSLFPHSLKITLLSSPILFTPVYFYRYALYQGNLSIYHSLNFIRSLLLYLLNPLSPLTSLPPQHVSLFPWIISWNDPFLIPSPFSIIRMLLSLFSYFKSASCPFWIIY